jgi:nitroreductase
METLQCIAQRRSTRRFTDQPIPRGDLEALVNAGRVAATARNEQPWEFVVVTEPERLKTIGEMTDHGRFIADGTACIIVYCRDTKYYLEDGCAATENILLAAEDRGIQSCWVAGDKKPYCQPISEYLGAPAELKLVALIALGYEAEAGHAKEKRPLEDVIHWEQF